MTALNEHKLMPWDGGAGNTVGWSKVWMEVKDPDKWKFISEMLSFGNFLETHFR